MTNQTDPAGSRQAEKITIGQVAEKLLLIARLLERAGVAHEARLQRLTEEYRNVNPGDDKRKTKLQKQKDDKRRAELQKDIADCGKAPLAIMEDSVRKMAAMMKVAAEAQLLDAEAARIAATYPSDGVSWFEYLADLQRHYCGIAAPTIGDMEVTASAIDAIARAMAKPEPAAGDAEKFMPAGWFKQHCGLLASRLRKAAERGQLRKTGTKKQTRYSVSDAMRQWPEDFPEQDPK